MRNAPDQNRKRMRLRWFLPAIGLLWAGGAHADGLFGTAGASGGGPGWLAYGDLRGHVEPCGCDPTTDLGGIKRLGVVLDRERSVHPETWVFSLGNDLPPKGTEDLKAPFLAEADAALASTAALANTTELQRLGDLKEWQAQKKPLPPYVLSNGLGRAAANAMIHESILVPGGVVLGYTAGPLVKTLVQPFDQKLAKHWRQLLAENGQRTKILLFSGPQKDLLSIVGAKLFDVVISSNNSSMQTLPGTAERDDETKLSRLKTPLAVAMVPLAGQGLLRGGARLFDEAKPIAALLGSPGGCPQIGKNGLLGECPQTKEDPLHANVKLVTWLDTDSATSDGPLKGLYDRYSAATRQAFQSAGAERVKDLKHSPFAGSASCTSCHKVEAEIYSRSAHAHAMKTLVDKGKSEDPECVACHSVGAQQKGGFVSLAASPQLANVQCENCHGALLAHTQNPKAPLSERTPPHDMCVSCHLGQHSPKFDFAAYWPRIAH